MHRVSPSVGSTRTNDMNNLRPYTSDQNVLLNPSNTLDSFVIKRETSQHFEEPILKNEKRKTPKRSSDQRGQRSIEDYMFKSPTKRLKK